MGRRMQSFPPKSKGQFSDKVYWKSMQESSAIRARALSLGKTLSTYLRDLAMIDLAGIAKLGTEPGTMVVNPFEARELPPGLDENTILFPEEEQKKNLEEQAEEELRELLKDS